MKEETQCILSTIQRTIIQVKTGAGMSARGLAGPVTGQGGGGAALACDLNLDRGVDACIRGSKDEDCYDGVKLQSLTFLDDCLRRSRDVTA